MNYEEKYKQALKKAKGIYIDATKEHCAHTDWLESIFPELAESEDERIRKEIIDFVVDNTICKDGRREKYLAWLEKQGKQKPVEESWPNLSNCLHDCKNCTGRCIYRKEEYQKQKSVEWSEEDEETRKMLCNYFEDKKANCIEMQDYVPVEKYPFTEAKMYETALSWLKSLKDKVMPQSHWKPSEEQMEIIKMVLTDEAMDDNVHSILESLYNDLEKLM